MARRPGSRATASGRRGADDAEAGTSSTPAPAGTSSAPAPEGTSSTPAPLPPGTSTPTAPPSSVPASTSTAPPPEPVPEAPAPALLQSLDTHIATAIWEGRPYRGALKCHNHSTALKKWQVQEEATNTRFWEYIAQSGLAPLITTTYSFCNKTLVSAFVERWHPETNTFHFDFGEMSCTLDDVHNILGIRVDGRSVEVDGDDNYAATLVQALGVEDNIAVAAVEKGGVVTLEWLRSRFSNVSDADSHERIACCARAYLLYLLGCTLFVDKSGTRVSVLILRLLYDLGQVNSYAWGSAALAYLYRQLGQASRAEVKQMGGYITLLEVCKFNQQL